MELHHLGTSNDSPSDDKLVTVPDVRNNTITAAKKSLSKFKVNISSEEDEKTTMITDQVPKPGVALPEGSDIYLYTEKSNSRTSTTVPNLKGMSKAQATNALSSKNLNIVVNGSRCCK